MYLWKWDGNREVGTVASIMWKDDDAIATWWLAVGVVQILVPRKWSALGGMSDRRFGCTHTCSTDCCLDI
jgi:hypothetical protein